MAGLERDEWVRTERIKLQRAIWVVLNRSHEHNVSYWMKKLLVFFDQRLNGLEIGTSWICFLAGFSDEQAWGRYRGKKERRLCLAIRDYCKEVACFVY